MRSLTWLFCPLWFALLDTLSFTQFRPDSCFSLSIFLGRRKQLDVLSQCPFLSMSMLPVLFSLSPLNPSYTMYTRSSSMLGLDARRLPLFNVS